MISNKIIYIFSVLLLVGCQQQSDLKPFFNCSNVATFNKLQSVTDVRKHITLQAPTHWKKSLYFDDTQSSITIADTTIALTKTVLLDVSVIHTPITFNSQFQQKINNENNKMKLENTTSKTFTFKQKPSYINIAKGKKGNYTYKIVNLFSQLNDANFLHIKTEVYGDSLIDQRICKTLQLIDKIQFN